METVETLTDKALTVLLSQAETEVLLVCRGKSNEREPGLFLSPIFNRALQLAAQGLKKLVMDFSAIEYMNSSTFGPLVKMLDSAARSDQRVLVEYSGTQKWQVLSFSALKAFETADGRIVFRAK